MLLSMAALAETKPSWWRTMSAPGTAREMAEEALKKRLDEIEMNDAEFSAYDTILDNVSKEIVQLRLVLDAAESRQQEREWQKFQLDGELDDARLVDGVAGERHVYRKRGIKQPDIGAPQRLPKRVRFVFDISGSNATTKSKVRALRCAGTCARG